MIQGSLTKMDGVSAARGLTTFSRSGNLIIDTFIQSYAFIVSIGAIPARLYYRENLGERAFSPFALIICLAFYGYFGAIQGTFIGAEIVALILPRGESIMTSEGTIGLYLICLLLSPVMLFLVFTTNMGIKHFKKVFQEADEKDVVRYSYYRGDSRYFKDLIGKVSKRGKVLTEQYVRMIVEPRKTAGTGLTILLIVLAVILVSYLIDMKLPIVVSYYLSFFLMTSLFILFSAQCLYLEEFGIKLRVRGKVLDMTDGEYDMMFIKAERDRLKLISDSAQNTNKSTVNKLSDEDSIVIS
ncbi:hypothetical protein [Phaeodactylibacter sp.]|uniref:hypothetical protein n=1 Tax=Phaeodactylibacter sp. TaxID=1940289 RepID=UPI0025E4553A|nr:hypothetical protein [Phaeodactylibacter sp.]MCI5091154.1 hypothetical protein [Phaeodactylibacter sp.]